MILILGWMFYGISSFVVGGSNSWADSPVPEVENSGERAPVYLEVGEQRIFTFTNLYRYSVSGDSVRYFRLANQNEILIKAIKPGIATLYLQESKTDKTTRLIRVEQKKSINRPAGLLQALNPLNQTEVIEEGNHYILRGRIKSFHEARAVAYLRDHFQDTIIDETEIEPSWLEKSKAALADLIEAHPSLHLKAEEGAIEITGGLPTPTLTASVIKKIHAIQPLAVIEIQTLTNSNPTIYFKVFLLEVKKEEISSIGVEWPETMGAGLQVTPLQLLFDQGIDLTIHALSQKGLLKILSSPELVVRAPGQAELFAGGELPIRQRSKFSDSVTWKNVGLSLKLDVKEFGGEKVRLNIETEINHLDQDLKNDDIPGIQSNRIKTQVDATLGKPLLLSGLLQEDVRNKMKGLPAMSSLPILGKLFSSEDFQNNRSELVAILLPHREPPAHPMERISSHVPRGFLPLPRNYINSDDEEELKQNKHYPWNVL